MHRVVATAIQPAEGRGIWPDWLLRLAKNRGATIGLAIFILLVLCALFARQSAPYDPLEQSLTNMLRAPSLAHPFGTDQFGRDVLSRVIYGSRISLPMGFVSAGIAACFGVILGLAAGYYGGWINALIMRLTDVMLAFPTILLSLGIVAMLGPDLKNVMIAVGIAGIPNYTRLVCGCVLSAKANLYVEAARTIGCSNRRIMFVHILPNVFAPVIVLFTLGIAWAILTAAALSFLGLGAQPPTPEWGLLASEGRNYLRDAWWITTFPGFAIMITVLAINKLGDGLRDALDPRLKI
ncbi:MAG: ABC transporter permease [Chloroflexi bacterium]|nr:ABC transporter permease [Chloroflexota bacterium]MCL5074325.1 ABC transporter permease [Chloroflexota bacterium]